MQWDSLQDPVRIEREQAETRRLARQANTATNTVKNRVESSEISQEQLENDQSTEHMPTPGKISPKEQDLGNIALQLGKISPKQQQKKLLEAPPPIIGKIPQQKMHQSTSEEATTTGEGMIVNLNGEDDQ